MDNKEKQSFPMLPPKNWWTLRKRFKQAMPDQITAGYLAPVLHITEKSAKNNVLPYLKTLGFIDEEGNITALANDWRTDEKYSEVCNIIKKKVYPKELLDAIPEPLKEKSEAESWFARKTRSGQNAAKRMTRLYALLCEADPSKGAKISIGKTKKKKTAKRKKDFDHKDSKKESEIQNQTPLAQTQNIAAFPSIHIDLQIHLSPETDTDQIDQIFASMSKHLKGFFSAKRKTG
jgi:hypothetical protein